MFLPRYRLKMNTLQCVIGQEVLIVNKIHDLIYWKTENLRPHNSARKEKAFHVFG